MVRKRINIKYKRPTVAEAEKAIGLTADRWKGNCYGIACAFVDKKLVEGVAVYGHWLGTVDVSSMFFPTSGLGFIQHGWIVMPHGKICDPTRWEFEGVSPYVYVGPNGGNYDEGGNQWREALMHPPPKFDIEEKTFEITSEVMNSETWNFVEKKLELDYDSDQPIGVLTVRQLMWLANLSPRTLGQHAGVVLDALRKLDLHAFMPVDNKRFIDRMRGKG